MTTNYSQFCATTTQEQYNNLKAVFIKLSTNSLLKTFINKWHQESQLSSNGRICVKAAIFFFVADGEYPGRVFMMLGLVPKRQYVENDPF